MTIAADQMPHTADNLGLMRLLTKIYSGPITVSNAIGTVWIFALMLMIVADILGRKFFGTPVRGVVLIVSHSIVGIIFLQMASSLEVGRITRTSVLVGRLLKTRPFAGAVYQFLFHSLGAAVMAEIAYWTWPKLVSAWETGEWEGAATDVMLPLWPLKAIIVFGATTTSLQFIRLAVRDLSVLVTGVPQDESAAKDAPKGWGAIIIMGLGILVVLMLAINSDGLSNLQIGMISVGAMLLLIYSGMHIAIALILLSIGGMSVIFDGNVTLAFRQMAGVTNTALNNYTFGVVPLFVLTGLLVSAAEFGREAFEVAEWIFGRIVGGLGVATVAANAVFAAITGVSLASAAVFTRVAVPPMVERGFTTKFAVGTVAGSSVLGMLIPPSLLLIVYGIVTEASVGKLFLAAIIPGIVLATAFAVMIIVLSKLMPNFVGVESPERKRQRLEAEKDGNLDQMTKTGVEFFAGRPFKMDVAPSGTVRFLGGIIKLIPILALMLIVLGGIYGGFFSPTEAGAAGAFAALVIALIKRRLTWRLFWDVMLQTGHIATGVLFLIMASMFYAQMLALSSLPATIMGFVMGSDFGLLGLILAYMVVLLILGMILDPISIVLITVPMIYPAVEQGGGSLIWFGIITIIAVEAGLLTPPLGLTVFVVQGIMGDDKITVPDVFKGSFPFVITMILVLIFLISQECASLVLLEREGAGCREAFSGWFG
jgi:TRAP-type C4-dicarboxylate transport system permease large subunit/TRAP-type mannitol/chloroaromatic compound transport system permease small subunit